MTSAFPLLVGGLEDDGGGDLTEVEDAEAEKPRNTEEDDTSEEERELPGQRRPKRGEGWWGIGRPIQPHRKGLNKEFVDGAGLPSPGRWKVNDRRLPDDDEARDLR